MLGAISERGAEVVGKWQYAPSGPANHPISLRSEVGLRMTRVHRAGSHTLISVSPRLPHAK